MPCARLDPSRRWLVGGGLPEPWSYGQLLATAEGDAISVGRVATVTEVLIRLVRSLARSEITEVEAVTFTGEGQASLTGRWAGEADPATRENPLARSDAHLILTTSGSSGQPRQVRHSVAELRRGLALQERHRDDIWGLAYNPTHIAGVQVFLQALGNGNTIVNLWGVSPDEVVRRCELHRVTHLSGTPTFFRLLLAVGQRLPAIRSISLGGERSAPELLDRLRQLCPGAKVRNIYASTEAGSLFTSEGDEFVVEDPFVDRVRFAQNHLWLHRSLLGAFEGCGEWYDTGDIVEVTSAQPVRFRVLGRETGWINVGGEKVNPEAVEAAILTHPGIALAKVYGLRNSVTGHLVTAEVVRVGDGPSEVDLRRFLGERLPAHQVPRIIRWVDALELTRSGKVVRRG